MDPHSINELESTVTAMSFDPTGEFLATGHVGSSNAILWDLTKDWRNRKVQEFKGGHDSPADYFLPMVKFIAISHGGQFVTTAGIDERSILWIKGQDKGVALTGVEREKPSISKVSFFEEGKYLVIIESDQNYLSREWMVATIIPNKNKEEEAQRSALEQEIASLKEQERYWIELIEAHEKLAQLHEERRVEQTAQIIQSNPDIIAIDNKIKVVEKNISQLREAVSNLLKLAEDLSSKKSANDDAGMVVPGGVDLNPRYTTMEIQGKWADQAMLKVDKPDDSLWSGLEPVIVAIVPEAFPSFFNSLNNNDPGKHF